MLQNGYTIKSIKGKQIRIVEYIAEGGQGEVYKVDYNGKTGSVRFWIDCNKTDGFGKGIFGLFDESFMQGGYNSHNFGATINRSGRNLELNAHLLFSQSPIKSGKQLGEYIFRTIMERVKQ